MMEEKKVYSHFEVSSHNSPQDCWVIINAKVYDITSFLNEHPGGDNVLLAVIGKDASEEFEDVGHGSAARLMLDEFYVGEINPSITRLINTNSSLRASSDVIENSTFLKPSKKFWYLITIIFGIVAYLWYGIEA